MTYQSRRYNKDILLIVFGLAIIILILLLVFRNNNNKNQQSSTSNTTRVTIAPSGMKYPVGWREVSQISLADKDAGIVSEAARSNPAGEVILRVVEGNLAKNFDINTLPSQIVAKLRNNLSGFVLVSNDTVSLGKDQAVRITYKDSSGQQVYEHTQYSVPTANKTFYFTISAKKADFKKLSGDISKLSAALAAYIPAHK